MAYHCHSCGCEISLSAGKAGRRDTCDKCGCDVHACFNCVHYDKSAYNECREPQAERVIDKDRSNFCDYFSMREGKGAGSQNTGKNDALKKLDDLFK